MFFSKRMENTIGIKKKKSCEIFEDETEKNKLKKGKPKHIWANLLSLG